MTGSPPRPRCRGRGSADAKSSAAPLKRLKPAFNTSNDSPGMTALREAAKSTLAAGWPFRNIYNVIQTRSPPTTAPDVKGNFSGGPLRPWHDKLADYVGVQFGSIPKIILAIICWQWTVDMESASQGYDLAADGWVLRIVLRDLMLMVVVAGGWDWLLYLSPLKERLAPYKINPTYPDSSQLRRDVFWTMSATLLASVQEVVLMRWWASGFFKRALFSITVDDEGGVPWGNANTFFGNESTATYILWTATMLYWRITHFYCVHRGMHPWWNREGGLLSGDFGAVLYKYVHAHHHKSYNPTAWSGISMLPIESISYMSAALIPMLFRSGCHPWIHLYTKLDLIIGAQLGHDGFDAPGNASYFHQLHHAHFECNYGDAAGVPWDWMFGTFEDGISFARAGSAPGRTGGDNTAPLIEEENRCITMEEVAKHNSRTDCWIVINGTVLDVTSYLVDHPGGEKVLLSKGGKNATKAFQAIHQSKGGSSLIQKHCPNAAVGVVRDWTSEDASIGDGRATSMFSHCSEQIALNVSFGFVCICSWSLLMGDGF